MLEISRERFIAAPAARIWAVAEPVARLPEWYAGISAAGLLDSAGLGRRQRVTGQWGRHPFAIEQTVVTCEPERVLAWVHDRELLDGRPAPKISAHVEQRLELIPADGGTRVRLVARHTPANFFAGWLLRLIAARRIGGLMEQSLERLEKLTR